MADDNQMLLYAAAYDTADAALADMDAVEQGTISTGSCALRASIRSELQGGLSVM